MANDEKQFNIPRGPEEEYKEVRDSLKNAVQGHEGHSFNSNSVTSGFVDNQAVDNQSFNNNQTINNQGFNTHYAINNQNFNSGQVANKQSFNSNKPTNPQNPFGQGSSFNQNNNFEQMPNFNQDLNNVSSNNSRPKKQVYFKGEKDNTFVSAAHSVEPTVYKPKKHKSPAKTVAMLACMILIILGMSWALREFVFQVYEISSGSMERTIMTGDMVFAEKMSYKFAGPKDGDIVTFDDPVNPGRILIKRVIATEGQTVLVKDGKLFIDNEEQKESYVNGLPTLPLRPSNINYPYKIPEGMIWVMGDNRTNSQDSRAFGCVPVSSVIGRALFVYWPFSNMKTLE